MPWAIYWVITKLRGDENLDAHSPPSSMTKNKGGKSSGPLDAKVPLRGPIEMNLGSFPVLRSPLTHAQHSAKMGHALLRLLYSSCTVLHMPLVSTTIQHLHSAKNGPCPLYQQLCNSSGSTTLRSSCWSEVRKKGLRLSTYKRDERDSHVPTR
jgi:hypothetical protein